MGNFSRNTFDPLKNYVGVRLQQGVPVLDADWNELNDVTRHELYENCNLTFTDGVRQNSTDLFPGAFFPPSSDFYVGWGTALVQGRIVHIRQQLYYSTQPWTDPKRAARDGVAVIPPLTTPMGADRTDVIYLDVWDREVGSTDDASLVNPAVGIETCVRLKREAAVRVAEGTTSLPSAPAGHFFMLLGLLHRLAGQPKIGNIEDRRPFIHGPRGSRVASFFPAFLPVGLPGGSEHPAWKICFEAVFVSPFPAPFMVPKFHALKSLTAGAFGVLPLILPDGAFLTHLNIRGDISHTNGELHWQLIRICHPVSGDPSHDVLLEDRIRSQSGVHVFDTSYALPSIDPMKLIVDNSRYYYALYAESPAKEGMQYGVRIHGVSIPYRY